MKGDKINRLVESDQVYIDNCASAFKTHSNRVFNAETPEEIEQARIILNNGLAWLRNAAAWRAKQKIAREWKAGHSEFNAVGNSTGTVTWKAIEKAVRK